MQAQAMALSLLCLSDVIVLDHKPFHHSGME